MLTREFSSKHIKMKSSLIDSYIISVSLLSPLSSAPHPLSYPAAVVLHQVQLDGLHAAIVTARVDLKHKTMI